MRHMRVDTGSLANAGILQYLEGRSKKRPDKPADFLAERLPERVFRLRYNLGTHPELVERLWDELTVKLPVKCEWVVYGTPILVHLETGIIFSFAVGTHTYTMRLPNTEHRQTLA